MFPSLIVRFTFLNLIYLSLQLLLPSSLTKFATFFFLLIGKFYIILDYVGILFYWYALYIYSIIYYLRKASSKDLDINLRHPFLHPGQAPLLLPKQSTMIQIIIAFNVW